jgi:hypothetical protein
MRHALLGLAFLCVTALAASGGPDLEDDWGARVREAKLGLSDAAQRGLRTASEGVLVQAELEVDAGRLVYSIDVAQGARMRNVVLDAKTGEVLEDVLEDEDHAAVVAAFGKVGLLAGVDAAAAASQGTPFYAVLRAQGEDAAVVVAAVDATGRVKLVRVDAKTGAATVGDPKAPEAGDAVPPRGDGGEEFTDRFPEDRLDLVPTGRSPYFLLEPGWTWVLEGTEGGKPLLVTYTVLEATKTIDGVECRAVESREELAGAVQEITRDYYAISRKTANVYYFGEAVDEYRDGKVVGHAGQWFAGEGRCRWGLLVPAVPLIGARHYQEIAPGIAMDRVEIVSTTEVVETPAGTFRGVLKQKETNPEEPGHVDYKYYAPGVGMVKEEANLVLTRFGRK